MNFLPDGMPVIKLLECVESGLRVPHATWDYSVHLKCVHPTHYIFIKVCDCCGIMTEQTYINGQEQGIEVTYTHEEVMALIESI